MRILLITALSGLVIALSSSASRAQKKEGAAEPQDKQANKKNDPERKGGPEKTEPKLKAGDRAPELKADKWLQGKEVAKFAPGQVYVVEFWATWCGPCIAMMPHMSELQKQYRGKGVTMIGFSAKDPRNNAMQVVEFVKKRGEKLGYTFAYGDDRATFDSWMEAAGQKGIPCSFVVDKKGQIAYIGHPMYLDEVLPGVLAGTWQPDDGPALIAKVGKDRDELSKAMNGDSTEAALKAIEAFNAKHPGLAQLTFFQGPQLNYMVKTKLFAEARTKMAESIKRAVASEDLGVLNILSNNAATAAKSDRGLGLLGLKASEAGLKIAGDNSWQALLTIAESHFSLGEKEKALEYAHKALDVAKEPSIKSLAERRIKRYEDSK